MPTPTATNKTVSRAAAMGLSVAKFFLLAADELIDRNNEELPFDTVPEFDKK